MSDDIHRGNWARRRRYPRSAAPPPAGPRRPQFGRFAAAMDEARAAQAPQIALHPEAPADGELPLPSGPSPWRATARPLVRWLGIGACVLLLGLLLATLRTQPIGAAIERLMAPGPEAQQEQKVAPAPTGWTPPVAPERAAARDQPAPAPLLVSEQLPPATRPGAGAPPHPAAAPTTKAPAPHPLPLPLLKPPPAD